LGNQETAERRKVTRGKKAGLSRGLFDGVGFLFGEKGRKRDRDKGTDHIVTQGEKVKIRTKGKNEKTKRKARQKI